MKYTFYLQNGTAVDSLPEGYTGFYIAEDIESDSELSQYFYPGDKIQYSLDSLCVDLYDIFQDATFPSRDEFYKNYGDQPQWISRAGLDSDFDMDKDQFVECFSTPIHERMLALGVEDKELLKIYQEIEGKKYRYAYVADCQSLVNTLQALIIGCHSSLIGSISNYALSATILIWMAIIISVAPALIWCIAFCISSLFKPILSLIFLQKLLTNLNI